MMSIHGTKLTKSQLLGRTRRNRVLASREPFSCPLCSCVPKEIAERISEKPYDLLSSHIARHLKSLSFLSLSYLDIGFDDESRTSGSQEKNVQRESAEVSVASLQQITNIPLDDIPETISLVDGSISVDNQIFEHDLPLLDVAEDWNFLPITNSLEVELMEGDSEEFKGFFGEIEGYSGESEGDSGESEGDSGESEGDSAGGDQKLQQRKISQTADHMYQRGQSSDSDADGFRKRRKQSHGHNSARRDDPPTVIQSTALLRIGDEEEVTKFYRLLFLYLQQSACKIIGKIFVKVVEPKKQTHYPYTGGAAKAPPWWPPTTGENAIRHKEPDHLYKHERVLLLVQILRMIIEPPERQHSSVRRWNLDVKTLEAKTMEAMENWFNDTENPTNASKKIFLKEIFRVARAEERYKNGEIDDDTIMPVMDRNRQAHISKEEDDDALEPDGGNPNPPMPSPGSHISPHSGQSGPSLHQPSQVGEPSSLFHNTRQSQFAEGSYGQRPIPLGYRQQSPLLQDPGRDGYSSQPYQNQSQNMYGGRNSTIAGKGPISSNHYVSSPSSPLGPPNVPYQLPLPNTQRHLLSPPRMNKPAYDNVPGPMPQYDTTTALDHQMRADKIGHPQEIQSHHGFREYIHDNPYAGNEGDSDAKHIPHD